MRALRQAGGQPEDVVRTRIYVADAAYWEEVGRAHAEIFRHAPPATTMVVTGFIDAEILVEIEADAIVD